MKSKRSRKKSLQKAYDAEKNASVRIRILLVIYVWTGGTNVSEAARRLKMSRARGPERAKRYGEGGLAGLRDPPGSGRPPKARPGIMGWFGEWPGTPRAGRWRERASASSRTPASTTACRASARS